MAANDQLKPFPYELYKDLQITDDNLVIQNGQLIGELAFPQIIESYNVELSYTRIEELLKQGIEVYGYENYYLNDRGVPVLNYDVEGYPKDTTTIDVFGLVYHKNICVGKLGHPSLKGISKEMMDHLDKLGIKHSFQWGMIKPEIVTKPKILPPVQPEIIVVPYDKNRGLYRDTSRSGIIKQDVEGNIILTGMLKNGEVVQATKEEKQYYSDLGFKME